MIVLSKLQHEIACQNSNPRFHISTPPHSSPYRVFLEQNTGCLEAAILGEKDYILKFSGLPFSRFSRLSWFASESESRNPTVSAQLLA